MTWAMRFQRRSAVASQSSHSSVSRPKAAAAIARKRNWRGQFVKTLRETPPDSREWLIWSRYHNAWHCRCATTGGAAGYTSNIALAGVFVRAKADSYNDGDRNVAFHVSEKVAVLAKAMRFHNEAIDNLRFALAAAAEGGDAQQAPGEAPQSGDAKQRNAQPSSGNPQ